MVNRADGIGRQQGALAILLKPTGSIVSAVIAFLIRFALHWRIRRLLRVSVRQLQIEVFIGIARLQILFHALKHLVAGGSRGHSDVSPRQVKAIYQQIANVQRQFSLALAGRIFDQNQPRRLFKALQMGNGSGLQFIGRKWWKNSVKGRFISIGFPIRPIR